MPKLIEELSYYADISTTDAVGTGPFGTRMIVNASGGKFTGDRLKGELVGTGADWLLFGADGYGRIDVRLTFKTHDGALIYVQYHGILQVTPAITQLLSGGGTSTDYGDQYFFTTLRLETGDARYAWVNQTVFVGQGRLLPGPRVEYKVFRVAN